MGCPYGHYVVSVGVDYDHMIYGLSGAVKPLNMGRAYIPAMIWLRPRQGLGLRTLDAGAAISYDGAALPVSCPPSPVPRPHAPGRGALLSPARSAGE